MMKTRQLLLAIGCLLGTFCPWPNVALADDLVELKATCADIGFKPKTEAFGQCVLELRDRQQAHTKASSGKREVRSAPQAVPEPVQKARGDGTPDDTACAGYGFKVGTTPYAQCRQQIAVARRDAQQRQAQYELEMQRFEQEKQRYEEQLAAYEREKERQRGLMWMKFGAALAGGTSPYFSENLANASRQMLGLPPTAPAAPKPQTFFIQGPGGHRTCDFRNNFLYCF